jgi:adenine-specific DNA-methyltransferase
MAKKTTPKKTPAKKSVATLTHTANKRKNIPTAEYQSVVKEEHQSPIRVAYERRNRDLDPQLVWRGKDEQDWSDLVVHAPPLYIQEKVHPKVLIDDLLRQTRKAEQAADPQALLFADLYADFNGMPEGADKTDFYQHDQNWSNRMILGDSLQVMAALAEREGLRGQVQCIYIDPPYGIKFNSNFQWSTTSRDVKDGKADHITREPEQVKAFRDTWRDNIHSYLTYLRDRFTVARDLLADSGSIFVQIGDENVHRVRAVMYEVFGEDNVVTEIVVKKKGSQKSSLMDPVNDFILWYSKCKRSEGRTKFRTLYEERALDGETLDEFSRIELTNGSSVNIKSFVDENGEKLDFRAFPRRIEQQFPGGRLFRPWPITNGGERAQQMDPVIFEGEPTLPPKGRCWSHTSKAPAVGLSGMSRNLVAGRLVRSKTSLDFKRYLEDFPFKGISNWWDGLGGAPDQVYVVQTNERIIERCILMATDPGDVVLDPTCGSGTTAYVAEQWGRRWITIDTSRVALALARARIMGARYPYYLLADSPEGHQKEAEITRTAPSTKPSYGNIRHGFVYRRCAYITSGSIANNAEIDVIWDKWQATLEPLREMLNAALKKSCQEWEIPRDADTKWPDAARKLHADWWQARIARQKEIDASIAAKAEFEYLYDKPYDDKKKVRVAGPFTVESLSPHRALGVDENDELIDPLQQATAEERTFEQMILENLKTAGVQQAHKEDRIAFTVLTPWPGAYVCAEGRYLEGDTEKRAAILIGPEFGTVQRQDLVLAAREAGDAGFDALIACAFNYEAHTTEFNKLGRIPVLKARMNADLHMSADLKNTGKGNLFVIFGEPDLNTYEGGSRELTAEIALRESRLQSVTKELEALKGIKTDEAKESRQRLEDESKRIERFLPHAREIPTGQVFVELRGVDVFHPNTGAVRSDSADGIACWFIDTDYNEESFFVRHAYFLGAGDPYSALKTSLKAEINADAWATLNSDMSRPFDKPKSGRIAVKVINHLGDEVMKVFRVE